MKEKKKWENIVLALRPEQTQTKNFLHPPEDTRVLRFVAGS